MSTYTPAVTFSNGTIADGGQINTEFLAIQTAVNSQGNLGPYTAWTDYTPTIYKADNATALAKTVTYSRYTQIGKMVVWSFNINNFADPAGNTVYLTVPVTANYNAVNGYTSMLQIQSGAGPTSSIGLIQLTSSTKCGANFWSASAWGAVTANNLMQGTFIYEAA